MALPRGRRGSNQYATKGAPTSGPSRVLASPAAQAAQNPDVDPDAESVAWAFSPERQKWAAHGFGSWEQSRPWIQAGWNPEYAREYANAGWDPVEGAAWDALGFRPCDDANGNGREDASAWRDAGFDPDTARQWVDEAFLPHQAARWTAVGIPPNEARGWSNSGFNDKSDPAFTGSPKDQWTPEAAQQWRDAGFDSSAALWWNKTEYGPGAAKAHRDAGRSPVDAHALDFPDSEPI